jgi:hypothetical protein
MKSETFINEFGNEIKISAVATNEIVSFTVVGPNSVTNQIFTREEAERLYRILGLVMSL